MGRLWPYGRPRDNSARGTQHNKTNAHKHNVNMHSVAYLLSFCCCVLCFQLECSLGGDGAALLGPCFPGSLGGRFRVASQRRSVTGICKTPSCDNKVE
jgi:hypothetical protein